MSNMFVSRTDMQVIFVVRSFVHDVGTNKYELFTDPKELKEILLAYHISVDVVCAYMVIGNIQQHTGIFKFCPDFTCSDSFCAYVYWFLMKNVFLGIPMNILPGFEFSLSTKPAEETVEAYTERMRDQKIADVDMRIEQVKDDIPKHQADLHQFFFMSEKTLETDKYDECK
jgi:hypothetical protein